MMSFFGNILVIIVIILGIVVVSLLVYVDLGWFMVMKMVVKVFIGYW